MTVEFIPFQQALALKELGFDEPCFSIYYSKDKSFSWHHHKDHTNDEPVLDNAEFNISAPTFSQVLRWFREKYELHSWVTMELGSTLSFCWVITGEHKGTEHEAFFATYEEAELACLIKLIQILNQKL